MQQFVGHCRVDAFDDSRKEGTAKQALVSLPSGVFWMLGRVDSDGPYSAVGIGSNKKKREQATKLALALTFASESDDKLYSPDFAYLVQKVRIQRCRPYNNSHPIDDTQLPFYVDINPPSGSASSDEARHVVSDRSLEVNERECNQTAETHDFRMALHGNTV